TSCGESDGQEITVELGGELSQRPGRRTRDHPTCRVVPRSVTWGDEHLVLIAADRTRLVRANSCERAEGRRPGARNQNIGAGGMYEYCVPRIGTRGTPHARDCDAA